MVKEYLKKIIKEHFILISFIVAILFVIASASMVYVHFTTSPTSDITISLNILQNKLIRGTITDLYKFILLSFILIITNFFIARELESRNDYLTKVMTIGSVFLGVLILIAVNAILKVN